MQIKEEMHTREGLIKYTEDLFERKFEDQDFQWLVHVVEDFQPGKSAVFLKMHHSLSDAMGVIGLFSFLNNKATYNSIPKMNKPSIIVKAIVWLTFPFYVL